MLWVLIQYKDVVFKTYQVWESHCGDKTILRLSYFHNGISYIGKTLNIESGLGCPYLFQNMALSSVVQAALSVTKSQYLSGESGGFYVIRTLAAWVEGGTEGKNTLWWDLGMLLIQLLKCLSEENWYKRFNHKINFRIDICKVLAMRFRCNWINSMHLHWNLMYYLMLLHTYIYIYVFIFTNILFLLKYIC